MVAPIAAGVLGGASLIGSLFSSSDASKAREEARRQFEFTARTSKKSK